MCVFLQDSVRVFASIHFNHNIWPPAGCAGVCVRVVDEAFIGGHNLIDGHRNAHSTLKPGVVPRPPHSNAF